MTHAIDISKGSVNSAVSNQWYARPDDERFTSLSALRDQVSEWADQSFVEEKFPAQIEALYDDDRPDYLGIRVGDATVEPTHWGFDQIARVANAPSNYLRTLPAPLAALNINR